MPYSTSRDASSSKGVMEHLQRWNIAEMSSRISSHDDIKQLTDVEDIEVAVYIDEQEYVMSFNFLQNQGNDNICTTYVHVEFKFGQM